jgi:hypothetical protein
VEFILLKINISYGLNYGGIGVRFPAKAASRRLWDPQPLFEWVTASVFTGVKRPRQEADLPPPFTAKVENEYSYISPLCNFMAQCLI